MEEHEHSVVGIRCRKKKDGREWPARGTGFIVHMDPMFCLVMTCGHVLHNHIDGSIHVRFGADIQIDARLVFAEYAREVCMVRVDKSTSPESFAAIAGYPAVRKPGTRTSSRSCRASATPRTISVMAHQCFIIYSYSSSTSIIVFQFINC